MILARVCEDKDALGRDASRKHQIEGMRTDDSSGLRPRVIVHGISGVSGLTMFSGFKA